MTDVTLEQAAQYHELRAQKAWKQIRRAIDKDYELHHEYEHKRRQQRHWDYAALVRAAAKVVEEARRHNCEGHLEGVTTIHCRMCEALAAFDELKG